jgi:hypothetical protein
VALRDVPDAFTEGDTTARPGIMSLPREDGLGVVLAIVPTIAAHFDF